MKRRQFLAGLGAGAGVSVLDWLGYFRRHGVPGTKKTLDIAEAAAQATTDPHYLIYWFIEGGWDGFSMFNPVSLGNNALAANEVTTLSPSVPWSNQRYRPVGYPAAAGAVQQSGNIRYNHLASAGVPLFPDMSVVASHRGSTFHSGSRLEYHYGKYANGMYPTDTRGVDERTVIQAFCEAYGQSVPLPHVSWHRWLADGELALDDYPTGKGYYDQLGPAHAWTTYGQLPANMRNRLQQIQNLNAGQRDARIRAYVDNLHNNFTQSKTGQSVQAFNNAVNLHRGLAANGLPPINPATMFTDPTLRAAFGIQASDEATSSFTLNSPENARSKNTPNTNVQAMMTYELMTKGLSIGFWIESRDIRRYDTHRNRGNVLYAGGHPDQQAPMNQDLWNPLKALAAQLKATEHPQKPGKSFWDFTTIVVCSEMGRAIGADAQSIMNDTSLTDAAKMQQISAQDVDSHIDTSSVAFLGGTVKGNSQFGRVGTANLDAIPMMPDGTLDPAYNTTTGALVGTKNANSFISDAGHVYSTALYLSGINPAGKGRNSRPAMTFVKKP